MDDIAGIASYGLCAIAYMVLSILAIVTRTKISTRRHFVAACLATSLWAAVAAVSDREMVSPIVLNLAEILRNGSWIYFLLALLGRLDNRRGFSSRRILVTRAFAPIIIIIVIVAIPTYFNGESALHSFFSLLFLLNIILPVIGLLFIENLLRTSGSSGRWGIKHLCLGLGTVLAVDFLIHSDALVEGAVDVAFETARGLIAALVSPLIMSSFYRLKNWRNSSETKIVASPKPAFYTMALIVCGSYLLVMAGLAYSIHDMGERWGNSLQITFLVSALLVMMIFLTSSRIKSHLKIFIMKNFFSYKYDYREEWLRFIQTMSAHHPVPLGSRLVRVIADLIDSPAGTLWVLRNQDECFFAEAVWNLAPPHPPVRADADLIGFFQRTCRIIDIAEYRRAPDRYGGVILPEWITDRAAVWLIVPLIHRRNVLGFLVLDQARAPHPLDWEDSDLINIAAIQAASYLAEELAAEELRAARRLEDFNRQFAFVVHDIKNVVGQMSLMLENAKKFGDNPEFQKDMLGTVGNSVERMRALLEQLAVQRRQPPTPRLLELGAILGRVGAHWGKTAANFLCDLPMVPVYAVAVEATLVSVLDLLIDNALSACGPAGAVVLRLRGDGARIIIEVSDNGPGMEQAFVNRELFRPLVSTKSSGYGIGAYQTRHLVREMQAQLEVDSAPQQGTTMRIVLSKAFRSSLPADRETVLETGNG